MTAIKYILFCVVNMIDAWVGKGSGGGFKEFIVGFASLLVVILMFFASLFFLDRKTTLNYKTSVLCSIGITALLVCTVFAIMVLCEMVFY